MANADGVNREIEIKLDLGSFTNYLKLLGFLGQIEKEERHLNAFFDTEDRKLAEAGWALRVRVENSRGLVTIKAIASESGPAFIRQEMEAQISRTDAADILALRKDVMSLPVVPIDYLKDKYGELGLMILVKFENLRQKKFYKIADHNYILEIDKTEFTDGTVHYELEVELNDTSRFGVVEDALRKLFGCLDVPFEHQTESKFTRALRQAKIF